jgi:4-hydroxybenzoate polyprenyltransferase
LIGMALGLLDLLVRVGDHVQVNPVGVGLLALAFVVGAIVMRGAGCTYNDIMDRDIDAKVARTAARPLPSGEVDLRGAWVWLGIQLALGFGVWLLLPPSARMVALIAVPLVAAYPLMKRVTWWPQAWLGLTFNWGALVGAVAVGDLGMGGLELAPLIWLYAGLALWTLGYDTIYALQDVEDDALVGVKSTARLFGRFARLGVALSYIGSASAVSMAFASVWPSWGGWVALPFAAHLGLQVWQLKPEDPSWSLGLFRSNQLSGLFLLAGAVTACATVGALSQG